MYERLIQKLINRNVGATLCTASFRETSVAVGSIIHADFTWTDAEPYDNVYAIMAIYNPSGTAVVMYYEQMNANGSKTLAYVTDVAGEWSCLIQVYTGITWIFCTDTVIVTDEGEANILSVSKPATFMPNVPFHIKPKVRNDGASDTLFLGLYDTDTGETLKHPSSYTHYTGAGTIWEQDWIVTLSQTTDFHGRVDAGHVE